MLTARVNFPINDQILAWAPDVPPANWHELRARWSAAHAVRTVTVLAALVLLALSAVRGRVRG